EAGGASAVGGVTGVDDAAVVHGATVRRPLVGVGIGDARVDRDDPRVGDHHSARVGDDDDARVGCDDDAQIGDDPAAVAGTARVVAAVAAIVEDRTTPARRDGESTAQHENHRHETVDAFH